VCTADNIADILTKPLQTLIFQKFAAFMFARSPAPLRALLKKLTHLNALSHKSL
jgi:hypothetical protein